MKKTVLIPTDFSIESLKIVKTMLNQANNNDRYELIFLHGVHLSDSITDFLFYSKSRLIKSLTNRWFEEACALLKNKFSSHIHSIRKDVFTGNTQAAFDNFLLANNVDEAYIPANYSFEPVNKQSVDVIPFIKKSTLPVTETEWEVKEVSEREKLAEIFFS